MGCKGVSGRERAVEAFKKLFGEAPTMIASSPGRINVIGEHTDYNDGFVMPIAIEARLWIAFRRRRDEVVRVYSADMRQCDQFMLSDAAEMKRSESALWSNYIRGVAWALMKGGVNLSGMDACIASDIPIGAGLSSSAAIETASAIAMLNEDIENFDRTRLAKLCQIAENEFVGVRCGIMDQMICLHGKEGHAMLLDCRHLTFEQVFVHHPQYTFLIADTAKGRELSCSEYNIRRQQCEEGVKLLGELLRRDLKALRDVSLGEFESVEGMLPEVIRKRCRHVITENERVHAFKVSFERGDIIEAGSLMNQSHESLRNDYEVSCFELDTMVELLRSHDGIVGARLTGAGFGGCVIALIQRDRVEGAIEDVSQKYAAITGLKPSLYQCEPSYGATIEHLM
ncbi:MAG: galactokinase [Armatimonadota bacterium]|nr:galactokinase [Armatimonadota bacterium]MCX7777602.1 galactokinase [Armatimonadota bacterium]MDW8024720.1 galactokinase [Armatimonadota bacterium]